MPTYILGLWLPFRHRAIPGLLSRSRAMQWKTPKIVEVSLGAEINSYVCGDKK
jgi:coenzyme PQQ precursor peptide PqqA